MKYKLFLFLSLTVFVAMFSVHITERRQYKTQLAEKNENIKILQEKLSKYTSNQIIFNGKVKKSDLHLRQFLSLSKPDTCLIDTLSIVMWWDNLKPRERRKYRKKNL